MTGQLSQVQYENVGALFHALDATGDGMLDANDYLLRAAQMCAALAPDPASPEHQQIQAAYRQAWDELRQMADADHDGTVTRDEFVAAVEKGVLTDADFVERGMLVVTRALAAAADDDGDGIVSRDDYLRVFRAIELTDEMASAGFDHIDRDGDDRITCDDFVQALSDVFTTGEPDALGHRVFR